MGAYFHRMRKFQPGTDRIPAGNQQFYVGRLRFRRSVGPPITDPDRKIMMADRSRKRQIPETAPNGPSVGFLLRAINAKPLVLSQILSLGHGGLADSIHVIFLDATKDAHIEMFTTTDKAIAPADALALTREVTTFLGLEREALSFISAAVLLFSLPSRSLFSTR